MLLFSQFRFLPPHITRRLRFQSYSSPAMVADSWRRIESHPPVPPYSLFTKQIDKSQLDDREYRLIKLENGLLAMLVHDAKADIAAASLDVAVGHLSDPVSPSQHSACSLRTNQLDAHRMTSPVLLTSANTCYLW